MESDSVENKNNRPLTSDERSLAVWILEHGTPEAKEFLPQLELAEVTPWRCKCGCASINFKIKGSPGAPPGVHILGDFMFGKGDEPKGVFIYSSAGILSGLEVFGYAGDHPEVLPSIAMLRTNNARVITPAAKHPGS